MISTRSREGRYLDAVTVNRIKYRLQSFEQQKGLLAKMMGRGDHVNSATLNDNTPSHFIYSLSIPNVGISRERINLLLYHVSNASIGFA
jgi:hypothetical protein